MVRSKNTLQWIAAFFIGWIFLTPHIYSIYFNQNYVYPKRCLVEFIVALVAFAFAFEKKVLLPTRLFLILSGILLAIKVIVTFLNLSWYSTISLAEVVSFGILCSYFMTIWDRYKWKLENLFWPFALCATGIMTEVGTQFIVKRIIAGTTNPVVYCGFFGNINMMSEYLVLLMPLGLYLVRAFKGWRSYYLQAVMTLWIFFAIASLSRSTWIAVGICFAYNVFKKMTVRDWATWVLAGAAFFALQTAPTKAGSEDVGKSKEVSLSKRNELYKGSLNMLLSNPMGIGGGGFEYAYTPYQMETDEKPKESIGWDFPHSEPLKWGIENGWAYLLTFSVFWILLGISIWKIPGSKELQTFFRTSYLVMWPQIIFQFPFENPASILVLAFIFAQMFLAIEKPTQLNSKVLLRVFLVVCASLFLYKAIARTTARWMESQHFDSKPELEIGCEMDPTNWRVCFYYGITVVNTPFYRDALPIALGQLRDRAWNFHALRILAAYYYRAGDLKRSCEMAKVYDLIFNGTDIFRAFIDEQCKTFPAPIHFVNSKQFDDDYRLWVAGILAK